MTMSYICGGCGSTRLVGYQCQECFRREQANTLIKQNERSFRANQDVAEESRRQSEFDRGRDAYYARQQENERMEYESAQYEQQRQHDRRMAELSLISSESNISSDDAFNHGVDDANDYINGKNNHFPFRFIEEGELCCDADNPYKTDRLKGKYSTGLLSTLIDHLELDQNTITQILLSATYWAGYNSYNDGNLPKDFYCKTGVTIGKHEIFMNYRSLSEMETYIERSTGELQFYWNHPFRTDALNQSFQDGVNAKYQELNTPELMTERLLVDVPLIIEAEQQVEWEEEQKRLAVEKAQWELEQRQLDEQKAEESKKFRKTIITFSFLLLYFVVPVILPAIFIIGFWFFVMYYISVLVVHYIYFINTYD